MYEKGLGDQLGEAWGREEQELLGLESQHCLLCQVDTVETATFLTLGLGALGILGYSMMKQRSQKQ